MNYHYGDLTNTVIEWILRTGSLERIVAIDLETKVLKDNDFLTGETVLCASLARFHENVILSRLILLERDDPESEGKLLAELNDCLLQVRPLVLVGYNLCGYDIPLLNLKLRQYPNPICWGIKDTIGRSFHLDMMHPVRFELAKYSNGPKILSLSKVVEHPRFRHLPLMRTKKLVSSADNKGLEIYNMWKNNRRSFKAYAEGDVNDVMLLFHELFLEPIFNVPTTKIETCAGWDIEK